MYIYRASDQSLLPSTYKASDYSTVRPTRAFPRTHKTVRQPGVHALVHRSHVDSRLCYDVISQKVVQNLKEVPITDKLVDSLLPLRHQTVTYDVVIITSDI